jgi:hypothetical protein
LPEWIGSIGAEVPQLSLKLFIRRCSRLVTALVAAIALASGGHALSAHAAARPTAQVSASTGLSLAVDMHEMVPLRSSWS